jgi:hypothetical protein
MMGKMDDDFIPKYAVTMWSNDTDVFVALPMTKGGVPYITKYPLNESGLSQALEVLKKRRKEVLVPTQENPSNYTAPKVQPQVRVSKAQERLYNETTPEQRNAAMDLLKKLGMVK